jgi:hypothetical protein
MALGVGVCVALLGGTGAGAAATAVCEEEDARLEAARVVVVAHDAFRGQKGVALKAGIAESSNGEMLRDGDGFHSGSYWNYTQTALLCYTYSGDPVVKGEFVRQGGLRTADSVRFLLLNDPELKADTGFDSLPLTRDFGRVLGGMVARTGWSMGADSADVVAEVKGGGYHFGNHQHADAGSLQIYYRGLQVAKLGQYKFYGTPYDMNFAKRSAAQSMLLVFDPQERILNNLANDGGLLGEPFEWRVPDDGTTYQVLCVGLQAGAWRVEAAGSPARDMTVVSGKNTLGFEARGGAWRVTPVRRGE